MTRFPVIAAVAALFAGSYALAADTPASTNAPVPLDRPAVEGIIRDYLLTHPEILTEAFAVLQQREEAEASKTLGQKIQQNQEKLQASAIIPVGGNPKGDVTLIEFFDYKCGFCKATQPELEAALAKDGKVRVIYKEFPILSESSVIAARAAMAAARQGKYPQVHKALMDHRGQLDRATILDLAKAAGADIAKLQTDMESAVITAELEANRALARELGITGTPAFIIGETLIPGAVDKAALQELFKAARSPKG